MASDQSTDRGADNAGAIPHSLRTALTMLLALHLFAVGVALLSNTASSGLIQQLRRMPFLFGYLQILNMDTGYNIHWTHGTEFDVDHSIFVDLKKGQEVVETVQLPPEGLWPLARARRYHGLAQVMAQLQGNDVAEPVIPKSVAGGVLAGRDVDTATIRFQGRTLLPREMVVAGTGDATAPERWRKVYEGTAWVANGMVQLLKVEDSAESAPAAAGPAAPE